MNNDTWASKIPTVRCSMVQKIVQISDVFNNSGSQAKTKAGFEERSNVARDFNVYTLMNRVNVYILVVYATSSGIGQN